MPWRVAGLIGNRREFCELVKQIGASAACRKFDISRKTGHKWLNRFSISTVARILARHGLVKPRDPKVVHPAVGRFGLPRQTLTDHGAQFRMEDHATSAFRTYLWACGVQHTQGRVAHPQTQGKIERFWSTFQTELTPRLKQAKPETWERLTKQWLIQYNTLRPHESLDDMTPASRYRLSERTYVEPDRRDRIGRPESIYRRVSPCGTISLGGQRLMIGRGLAYWTVEARPLGNGCWHIYYRNHFLRGFLLSKPIKSVTHVPVQVKPMS